MDEQPRLTDLVPTRLTTFAVVLLAGLAVVAALEVLYSWMPRLAALTTDGRVAALDLDSEGSLAVWFSSMTLAIAGLVAILIFTVRQHKTDDYRGHYRIWLWAAACWFLLSLDETASLHEGFKEMMAHVTGTRLFGDGSIWWVIIYFFLLGAVGTRLLVDMRPCRLSTLAMVATAGCYAVAVATQLGWILPESGARGVMLEEGAEMVGNLMLLLAMGLHARHVVFDAKGLLPQRRSRRDRAEDELDGQDDPQDRTWSLRGRTVTVHPPHGVPRPVTAPALPERRPERTPTVAQTTHSSARRKLTKAERKALRKRLAKMAMDRERQKRAG